MSHTMPAAAQTNQAATEQEVPPPSDGTRIFTGNLFRVRQGNGWAFTEEPPPAPRKPVRRPARIAQMLALAHRLQAAIDQGEYQDRADLARQLGFTRARISQLLNLILLAPKIQERILFMEAVNGVEPMRERNIRSILHSSSWSMQRREWTRLELRNNLV